MVDTKFSVLVPCEQMTTDGNGTFEIGIPAVVTVVMTGLVFHSL
jgi:hypothetical protein